MPYLSTKRIFKKFNEFLNLIVKPIIPKIGTCIITQHFVAHNISQPYARYGNREYIINLQEHSK